MKKFVCVILVAIMVICIGITAMAESEFTDLHNVDLNKYKIVGFGRTIMAEGSEPIVCVVVEDRCGFCMISEFFKTDIYENGLVPAWNWTENAASDAWNWTASAVNDAGDWIGTTATDAWNWITGLFK